MNPSPVESGAIYVAQRPSVHNSAATDTNNKQYSIEKETMGESLLDDMKAFMRTVLGVSTILVCCCSIVLSKVIVGIAVIATLIALYKYTLLTLVILPPILIASKPIWNGSLYNFLFDSLFNSSNSIEWLEPSDKRRYNNLVEALNYNKSERIRIRQEHSQNEKQISECLRKLQPLANKIHRLQAEASTQGIGNPTVPLTA